jgi:hypothetical protein
MAPLVTWLTIIPAVIQARKALVLATKATLTAAHGSAMQTG